MGAKVTEHRPLVEAMKRVRMKDFFDVWFLSQEFAFDGAVLSAAMFATFERRETPIPTTPPLALTPAFAADAGKMAQWRAFVARSRLAKSDGMTLASLVEVIAEFTLDPLDAARQRAPFSSKWGPKGPWSPSRRAGCA